MENPSVGIRDLLNRALRYTRELQVGRFAKQEKGSKTKHSL
jgi:hypothetical protein